LASRPPLADVDGLDVLAGDLAGGPGLAHLRLGLAQRRAGLVEFAHRDRAVADQVLDAGHVGLGAGQLGLGVGEAGGLALQAGGLGGARLGAVGQRRPRRRPRGAGLVDRAR
jgi:hypothetical protein